MFQSTNGHQIHAGHYNQDSAQQQYLLNQQNTMWWSPLQYHPAQMHHFQQPFLQQNAWTSMPMQIPCGSGVHQQNGMSMMTSPEQRGISQWNWPQQTFSYASNQQCYDERSAGAPTMCTIPAACTSPSVESRTSLAESSSPASSSPSSTPEGSSTPNSRSPFSNHSPTSHDHANVIRDSKYKTELCRQMKETGECGFGSACAYAHGLHELRPRGGKPR